MVDWNKIKAEYIRGGISYKALAEKYGVSFSTLQKVGAEEKWTDLKKKSRRKAEEKIVESVSTKQAKREDKIQTIADKLLEDIDHRIDSGSFIIEPKDVRAVTAALKDLREIKGYKSEADLREQMARIAKLEKEARDDVTDNSIKIVLKGDLEDYSV